MESNLDYNEQFTRIYMRYSGAVNRFLNRIVYNRDISEELAQDVFMKVFEKCINLDPDSPRTLNYLFTAAKNRAIDYLRRKRLEDERLQSRHFEEVVMDRQFYEDIENSYMKGEIISTMSDAIRSFPVKMRELFIERNFGNRTGASMARDSGISVYRMRKMQNQVSRKIKDSLKHYFECPD